MSRIRKLPLEQWDSELRAMTSADSVTPLEQGMMRMLAHCPEIAKGFGRFTGALKLNRGLSDRLSELVRLRISYHNQCRSCMAIRYTDAMADGVDEQVVCSLERPAEAENLSPAEKAAIEYADLLATNHYGATDETYERLRQHFSEAQIVELGILVAVCLGFGRLVATWNMVEELPAEFRNGHDRTSPWGHEFITVGSAGTAAIAPQQNKQDADALSA